MEDAGSDMGDEEIGVVPENEIYSDEDVGPQVDDAVVKVVHQESVLAVAISPSERSLLLTGGQDDVAILWTIEEKAGEKRRLKGS